MDRITTRPTLTEVDGLLRNWMQTMPEEQLDVMFNSCVEEHDVVGLKLVLKERLRREQLRSETQLALL